MKPGPMHTHLNCFRHQKIPALEKTRKKFANQEKEIHGTSEKFLCARLYREPKVVIGRIVALSCRSANDERSIIDPSGLQSTSNRFINSHRRRLLKETRKKKFSGVNL